MTGRPPPSAPRVDAPEALGAYFAQLAAEQGSEARAEQAEEPTVASSTTPAPPALQPRANAELWQDTLAGLRLRLPREVYQTCVRQATLIKLCGRKRHLK